MDRCSKRRRGICPTGILEAVERFVAGWTKDEADLSRQRHASVVGDAPRNGNSECNSRKETAVDGNRKATADIGARYQAD